MWHGLAGAQALIVFSRVGVYMRLPGVDAERFAQTVQSGGILGYIDALSGGSISRVGIFSLGVRPASGGSRWRTQEGEMVFWLLLCICFASLPGEP